MIRSIKAARGALVIVPASQIDEHSIIEADPYGIVLIVRNNDDILAVLAAAHRYRPSEGPYTLIQSD